MPFSEMFNLTPSDQYGLKPRVSISGGTHEFSDAMVSGKQFDVGGRIGVEYLRNDSNIPAVGGGVSGYYTRGTVNFSPEAQQYGAPPSDSWSDSGITGLDLSLDTKYGKFSIERNLGGNRGWGINWSKEF